MSSSPRLGTSRWSPARSDAQALARLQRCPDLFENNRRGLRAACQGNAVWGARSSGNGCLVLCCGLRRRLWTKISWLLKMFSSSVATVRHGSDASQIGAPPMVNGAPAPVVTLAAPAAITLRLSPYSPNPTHNLGQCRIVFRHASVQFLSTRFLTTRNFRCQALKPAGHPCQVRTMKRAAPGDF